MRSGASFMFDARGASAATLEVRRARAPWLIVFCGFLLNFRAFSCDITLPAFCSMA
jgi:hypothetical protein